MESADIYTLSKLRWQFFGSLTFRSEQMPEQVRITMFFALIRKSAKDFRVYFPALPWCLRLEHGEIGERLHFHFLLTGLPENAVCVATCFAMMRTWEKLRGGSLELDCLIHVSAVWITLRNASDTMAPIVTSRQSSVKAAVN